MTMDADLPEPWERCCMRSSRDPPRLGAFVLNRGDAASRVDLDAFSASYQRASRQPRVGRRHVDHLRYGLELLNRWARGAIPGEPPILRQLAARPGHGGP